jgi:hypothetical protein
MRARHPVVRGLAGAITAAALTLPVHASDALQWQALFDTAPRLPATVAQVQVTTRTAHGGLVVEASDPVWRQRAVEAEALLAPVSAVSAQQLKATLEAFNNSPHAARMAKGMEQALDDAMGAMQRGERPTLRSGDPDVDQLLRDAEKPLSADRLPAIAAHRLESQRVQPNAQTFRRRWVEQRRGFAQQHAVLDTQGAADPAAQRERAERHRQLAQQQLNAAAALQAAAIDALRPSVQKMAALAQQAEARGASAAERVQAYSWLKGQIDLIDAIARATIEDVGFWSLVRPADAAAGAAGPVSLIAASTDVALPFDGRMMPMAPHYPRGRLPAPWPPAASTPR